MTILSIKTTPYGDQKPGTSGLRKRVTVYQQPNYVVNYIQAIFVRLEVFAGKTLVMIGVLLAGAQILVSMVNLTGLGVSLSTLIVPSCLVTMP